MRNFRLELIKTRRLHLWLLPLLFFAVLLLWQLWGVSDLSAEELGRGYTEMLYQLPLMNALLLPTYLAVIASRLCDLETKGDMPKLLCTVQRKECFYDLKFLHEALYLLAFLVPEALLIPAMGRVWGFTEAFPQKNFLGFFFAAFAVGLAVLMVQHFLSMYLENQNAALIVGISGSFAGLFSLYLPETVSRWILWGYFGAFMTSRMNWDRESRELWYTPVDFPVRKLILFVISGAAAYILCRRAYVRKEY